MQDSLNYNISQKTWDMKFNFSLWLEVQESTKYYLAALSGYAQECLNMPKVTTNSESVYFKNELSYEDSFLRVVRKQ